MRRGTFWSPVPPGTVAVVGLPRPDEKSLAGTRYAPATRKIAATAPSSLNETHVFRLGVRELSGLARPGCRGPCYILALRNQGFGWRREDVPRKPGKVCGAWTTRYQSPKTGTRFEGDSDT